MPWPLVTCGTRISLHSPSSCVPARNRCEALAVDKTNEQDSQKETAPAAHTKSCKRKKHPVLLVGDSLLRGTEAPICRPDIQSGEVCCLSGAKIWDVTERLPQLVKKHRLLFPTSFSVWANSTWSFQVTSVTWTFVGKTIQLCTSHPSGSWDALRTVSCYRCWTC